jgi:hypothetical protein
MFCEEVRPQLFCTLVSMLRLPCEIGDDFLQVGSVLQLAPWLFGAASLCLLGSQSHRKNRRCCDVSYQPPRIISVPRRGGSPSRSHFRAQ